MSRWRLSISVDVVTSVRPENTKLCQTEGEVTPVCVRQFSLCSTGLEKLPVAHIVKSFLAFCGCRKFVTALTTAPCADADGRGRPHFARRSSWPSGAEGTERTVADWPWGDTLSSFQVFCYATVLPASPLASAGVTSTALVYSCANFMKL